MPNPSDLFVRKYLHVKVGEDILTGKVTHRCHLGTFCHRMAPYLFNALGRTPSCRIVQAREGWQPMAATADSPSGPRRRHLEALAREVEARGLRGVLVGAEEPMLRVVEPAGGRSVMVVAMPTSRVAWSYLWGRGGQADAADPARAAEAIAHSLGR